MEEQIYSDIENELERILSFWCDMKDSLNGGFYCGMNSRLELDRAADKSGVAAARNLWTFSRAYSLFRDRELLECADHAYSFLVRNLLDSRFGGAFWMLDCEGNAVDSRKHIYLQAFCIYALSEYYRASGVGKAVEHAMKLWNLVEERGYDEAKGAYREEFSRKWDEKENELISERGVSAAITANTHLHLLEAYTCLYKAVPTSAVRNSLVRVLDIFEQKLFLPERKRLGVFFDSEWNELLDYHSYGHDIEASWLIDKALKGLFLKDEKYHRMAEDLAAMVLESGINPDGSLANESIGGNADRTRIWWVQAEALTGFYNAWEKTGEPEYIKAAEGVWNYIDNYIVDHRPGGEWLYGRDPDNNPLNSEIAGSWKASYHNARCCIEIIERRGLNN